MSDSSVPPGGVRHWGGGHRRAWRGGGSSRQLALLLCLLLTGACANSEFPDGEEPNEPGGEQADPDFGDLEWKPQFEPDYNTLEPRPGVEVVTETQARTVVVKPDRLLFPKADNPEVLQWEAGKIVVSAPSDGPGANPLGFARRVVSVTEEADTLVVITEAVALQDIATGDLRMTFDYENVKSVDLSKLDLEWAAKNLYVDADAFSPSIESNPDNESLPELDENWEPLPPGDPFLGEIWSAIKAGAEAVGNAVGAAAKAVAEAATNVWKAVTADGISASVDIKPEIKNHYESDLFVLDFKHQYPQSKPPRMKLTLKGSGNTKVDFNFKPGVQVGLHLPLLSGTSTSVWLDVDSASSFKLDLDATLALAIESAGELEGDRLKNEIARRTEKAEEILAKARERYLGDPDMRPAGGWKRPIFISKPALQTVFAGPVPIVFTQTIQIDLECGFEAKAAISTNMHLHHAATFKFKVEYKDGQLTRTDPVLKSQLTKDIKVTGAGSFGGYCGLIPRLNVYAYDTLGINAGVRGSLLARASYASRCVSTRTGSEPKADVTLGAYYSVGIQAGGRIQPPGTSYLGTSGESLGWEIGPMEVYSGPENEIYEKTWTLNDGLGFCSDTCNDRQKNGRETDVDCGGGSCGSCANGKKCVANSDCTKGYCTAGRCGDNHCGNGVRDGDETGIDCGGDQCQKCAAQRGCMRPSDCKSGYCAKKPNSGSAYGRCVQNHCASNVQDANETGIDCGGPDCPKCAVRARCSTSSDCKTGVSDGEFCVPTSCQDRQKNGNETDVDCGGNLCSRCAYGRKCQRNSDCQRIYGKGYPLYCDKPSGTCSILWCSNGMQGGDETDVDCGGSCQPCDNGKKCQKNSDCSSLQCNPQSKTCIEACGAGKYSSNGVCVDVGTGYWSAEGSTTRTACTNAPANAEYTSPTASSANCPWTCKPGYLRDSTGTKCERNATVQYLTCNADEVVVGIHGRAGNWLDALGVKCARFDNGSIIGASRDAPAIGGSGGEEFSLSCEPGEVLYQVKGVNGWAKSAENQSWCSQTNLSTVNFWCKNLQTGKISKRGQAGDGGTNCTKPRSSEYSFDCGASGHLRGLAVDSANTSTYVGYMLDRVCR